MSAMRDSTSSRPRNGVPVAAAVAVAGGDDGDCTSSTVDNDSAASPVLEASAEVALPAAPVVVAVDGAGAGMSPWW